MLSTSKKSWLSTITVSYLFAVCIITFALNKQKNKQHNSKKQKNLANKQISQILVEVNVLLASRHNMVCSYSKEEESLEPFLYQFFIKLSSICILGLSWITLSCMLTFLKFTFWLSISPSQSKICGDILILTDRPTTRHFMTTSFNRRGFLFTLSTFLSSIQIKEEIAGLILHRCWHKLKTANQRIYFALNQEKTKEQLQMMVHILKFWMI